MFIILSTLRTIPVYFIFRLLDCSPTIVVNENTNNLDPESKITLGSLSPERLTPNLFLGINLENIGGDRNNITLEWTSFPSTSSESPSLFHTIPSQHQQQNTTVLNNSMTMSSIHTMPATTSNTMLRQSLTHSSMDINNTFNLENSSSSYDEIKYINVEQFNALNMDQGLLGDTAEDLMHSTFSINESMDKSSPLLDLDKPIMNLCSLETLDQRQQH